MEVGIEMPFGGQKEYSVWLVYRVVLERLERQVRAGSRKTRAGPAPIRAPSI